MSDHRRLQQHESEDDETTEEEEEERQQQQYRHVQQPFHDDDIMQLQEPSSVFASVITDGGRNHHYNSAEGNPHSYVESNVEVDIFLRGLGLYREGPATVRSSTNDDNAATAAAIYTTSTTEAEPALIIETDFTPSPCRHFEWMGRSLETLVSGFAIAPPILEIPCGDSRRVDMDDDQHVPSSSSGEDMSAYQRTSFECLNDSTSNRQRRRQKLRKFSNCSIERQRGGPNVSLSLLARETNGRLTSRNDIAATDRLKSLGGAALFNALDVPAAGMCSEVTLLEEAIDNGDWSETQIIISRISPRLIGDPSAFLHPGRDRGVVDDPTLPLTAHRFYAGGGRLGIERDAFVLAGGIAVLVRVFREPSFVGEVMARSYDARDLSNEMFITRLGHCWNETLACLRELVYSIPTFVYSTFIFDDNQEFLIFLFSLLSHDSCFEGAAALIEEILSLQSHSPHQPPPKDSQESEIENNHDNNAVGGNTPTFFLGNISNLYTLWGNFNCRQIAHFCRILALLIFEPEDFQLPESPAVLKSIELLHLRLNRAARVGRDSTVDMNQSILLGDEELLKRLLQLLSILNFAPPLRQSSPFHLMSHFPFIPDTLMMMGLKEFDDWKDVDRKEELARKLLISTSRIDNNENNNAPRQLHDLGSVTDMLEILSTSFMSNGEEPTNQLGHIIAVINAAQQAGVVAGIARSSNTRWSETSQNERNDDDVPRNNEMEDLASAAGILTDQVLFRRHYTSSNDEDHSRSQSDTIDSHRRSDFHSRNKTSEDAANMLQFNALLLGPYQVEILFVLCTLLGGRRKIDSQDLLKDNGIINILENMFERLPWDSFSSSREPESPNEQEAGIHGSGCECTLESALCVQYLRLLHNFCDRDCDNYYNRRLLLSDVERKFIFGDHITPDYNTTKLPSGLLSKILKLFINESDESPYRFWFASCVESFLRGSSSAEQVFVAKSGLMEYLIVDTTSKRLHCSGSLQTSFDLLGELCKGNMEVLEILVSYLDNEDKFRQLMSVAASNLVDSNVFIRSVILSLERISHENQVDDDTDALSTSNAKWKSANDVYSRAYLTHSWWDSCLIDGSNDSACILDGNYAATDGELLRDYTRPSGWFPTMKNADGGKYKNQGTIESQSKDDFNESCGRFGWIFKPDCDAMPWAMHGPNTIERLSWFLSVNRTRLLRDLLEVVNLKNINHENICCLNTAVCITIFAYRHQELYILLRNLKQMNEEELNLKSKVDDAAIRGDSLVDSSLSQAMKEMDMNQDGPSVLLMKRNDIMQNFREVLWFWIEYYTHRGRDRLSLEFSSRLQFSEWIKVVSLLVADDGAPTSLVMRPLRLPRSPYQRVD